jgi:hypothetical protein
VCVCVCVCMAGRYCFRLIAAVVVDFSPLLFTHPHTCRSFSSFILLPKKKNEKHFHSSYIHTYFNSFSFFSSYVITHPFFLFVAYLSLLLLCLFSLSNSTFFFFLLCFFSHTYKIYHTRKLTRQTPSHRMSSHPILLVRKKLCLVMLEENQHTQAAKSN